ncbi:MAG: tRNA lysidine(34) synthetase TilS [Lachnospiraceae bacterium]
MEQNKMLVRGEQIIVGVSGGADSVFLLLVLCEIAREYDLTLRVVHIHHMIRGAEADADAAFVKELCQNKAVPYYLEYIPVEKLAKQWNMSVEEAGRNERYRLFQEYRKRYQADKIAVAHHRDDNAETVLFQMLRGTGLKGLSGMIPLREDGVIRPLLHCSRKEIEAWLTAHNQPWRVDSTNLSSSYGRNKVRLDILPVILEDFGEGAVGQLTSQCDVYREMDEYFSEKAKQFLEKNWQKEERAFSRETFLAEPRPIQRYICMEAMSWVCGSRRDISHVHVEALLDLIEKNTVAKKYFPYGLQVVNQYGRIVFLKPEPGMEAVKEEPESYFMEMRMKNREELKNFKENSCTKCFDYDKIKSGVILRTRQPNDWMQLYQDGRGKKLKDILIDLKIPKEQRDTIPLVALNNEILWIVGYRRSMAYRVEDNTKNVLEISMKKQKGTRDDRES